MPARQVLQATPPDLPPSDAERLAAGVFGVAVRAEELESERDQNFLLRAADGRAWVRRRARHLAAAALLASACSHATPFRREPFEPAPPPDPARIAQRLLLIGDAGDPRPDAEPALEALRRQAGLLAERTTVVFLGDNVYERGMPDAAPGSAAEEERRDAERRVDAQIDAATAAGARAIFVPGNHDWDPRGGGRAGRVRNLDAYLTGVRRERGADVSLLPRGGCPGPAAVALGAELTLLALDTQWLLEALGGRVPDAGDCAQATLSQVQRALEDGLVEAAAQGRWAVVVAHHPLETRGPHGGFSDWRGHLFPFSQAGDYVPRALEWLPLPGLGSLLVGLRACCSPSRQDLSSGAYRELRASLGASLGRARRAGAAPLLYAAGHDHGLQLFLGGDGPHYAVVSGLGSSSKATPVGDGERTLFAHSNARRPGFVVVELRVDGGVRLAVVEWTRERPEGEEVYSRLLSGGRR
jgi:hypothetical protein